MQTRIIFTALLFFLLHSCKNSTAPTVRNTKADNDIFTPHDREQLTLFNTLDNKEILKRLFDTPKFDSFGTVVWAGNYADLTTLSIPLSYDGKFHTSLDTILYFVDTEKRNCAVAIFSTYNYQPDPFDSSKLRTSGCHFCGVPIGVALFHETEKTKWELYDFKKEITQIGYGGIYKTGRQDAGKIQLKKLGEQWTGLSITEGPGGNMGYLEGGEMLFSIEEYALDGSLNTTLKILLTNYYSAKETALFKRTEPEIRPVKSKTGYYDLVVRTIEEQVVKTATYRYAPEYGQYIKQKP